MKSANDGGRGQDNDDDDDDNDGEEEVDDNDNGDDDDDDNEDDDDGRGQDNAASPALHHLSWQSQNMGSRHFLWCMRIAVEVLYVLG